MMSRITAFFIGVYLIAICACGGSSNLQDPVMISIGTKGTNITYAINRKALSFDELDRQSKRIAMISTTMTILVTADHETTVADLLKVRALLQSAGLENLHYAIADASGHSQQIAISNVLMSKSLEVPENLYKWVYTNRPTKGSTLSTEGRTPSVEK